MLLQPTVKAMMPFFTKTHYQSHKCPFNTRKYVRSIYTRNLIGFMVAPPHYFTFFCTSTVLSRKCHCFFSLFFLAFHSHLLVVGVSLPNWDTDSVLFHFLFLLLLFHSTTLHYTLCSALLLHYAGLSLSFLLTLPLCLHAPSFFLPADKRTRWPCGPKMHLTICSCCLHFESNIAGPYM